ncbi:MAG: hypothetical protein Unbinned3528contig1000_23 [Prokaryotic dsDNA virus sp.]|nr:MAG: hypothetical protein Unbinned3528contig1000_23 [Prokaryotic dsDNA virus sp.]|tara:strand:- start:4941 stop:6086 length:1146 start_codon:yes stop_codon:yes gene_type:complete
MAIQKVNINTPIYIKVANANLNNCQLTIAIYTGAFQTSPTTTYTLRKNEVANNNYVIFEIGELIKDYIAYDFSGTFGDNGINLWVQTTATPFNSSNTALDAVTTIMAAFDGYGYFEDGFTTVSTTNSATTQTLNAHKGNGFLLMSNSKIIRKTSEVLKIPVVTNLSVNSGSDTFTGATTVTFKNGSSTVSSVTIATGVTNTTSMIEYATSTTATITSVEVASSLKTSTLEVIEDTCKKFDNVEVYFINKQGAIQRANFFLKSTQTLNVTKETFKSNTLTTAANYSKNNHQYKTRNINSRQSLTINSGYVPDDFNQLIEEIYASSRVWINGSAIGGDGNTRAQYYPVIVESKSVTFQTSLNNRLANYELQLIYAYDRINTIR